ncbi:ABC transporter permease [Nonomuraea sp. SYSU D8015]|uniref:ABC transporter permease n=1 Tax=Nonomuraea sp. SYSU D8015 TaxID=2593644 RepID=UPI0016614C74|nr:ABC transporter permease [Nonomuraea sp. SYSU D8015]
MTATLSPADIRTGSRAAGSAFTGTGAMVRLALRRDRIRLPLWVIAIAVLVPRFYSAASTVVAPTPEARAEAAQLIRGSFMRVLAGPVFGDGAVTSQQYFLAAYWVEFLLAAALMNILLITRHTRAEEQTGRAELIRAAVVGRHAQLTAALIVSLIGNAVLAVLVAAAAIGIGFPAASALLFGASLAAAGLVFAAVAAVTVQLTEHPRGAGGFAGVALVVAWLLRGVGAMQSLEGGPVFWLSPIGWSQQTRVLAGERWWPLALSALLAGLLFAGAYTLASRRDLGAAVVAPRPGRAGAPAWLRSPFTLALRLQQAAIGWWAAAFLAVGLTLGGMTGGMATTDLPIFPGADLGRAWISLMVFTGSLYTGVFAVLSVLRLRAEEVRGRVGPVLAGPTGRSAWLGSSLLVSALAVIALLTVYGAALGVGAAASTGDRGLVGEVIGASLLRIPEGLVLLAVPAALLGLAPRAAVGVGWAVLVYGGFVQVLGPYAGVPGWLQNTSVLSHLPWRPLGAFAPVATVVLTALAAALAILGLYGLRRRDLASG